MRKLWLVCLLVLLPGSAQAVVYWDEGFENTFNLTWTTTVCAGYFPNDSPWAEGCNPLRITGSVAAGTVHSGTGSLRGDYAAGCLKPDYPWRECGLYHDRTFPATTEVYVRFWYRTTGFTYDATGTKHFYLAGVQAQYPDIVVGHYWGQRTFSAVVETMIADGPPCSAAAIAAGIGSCVFLANEEHVPINDNQWYCVEVHGKYNTPGSNNGLLEIWVDGKRTLYYPNRTFVGTAFNGLGGNSSAAVFNRARIYVQAGQGLMYYDDFAVGNTRIGGCGGATTPTDTTPPTAPSNLVAQ